VGNVIRDCANCHTRNTPEWRRGPSGQRDLCNSCGLRWAKQTGRVSPRNSSRGGGNGDTQSKKSASPIHSSPLHNELSSATPKHPTGHKDGAINPAQLSNPNMSPIGLNGMNSAADGKLSKPMPPPSHAIGSVMTSIQEERETSQS
jgi:hypothetical protein